VGQKVSPKDIVAEATVGHKHVIIDVGQKLGMSPRQVTKLIRVKKGQQISKDDVLAASTGMFGREILSPAQGLVVATGGGKIVLQTGGAIMELAAGIPGMVTQVIGLRGVVIRATGAVVQGVWGNGKLDSGMMYSLMERQEDVLDSGRLDVSLRGSILLGGHVESSKVFQNAADLPVRGLILASMSPTLLGPALQASFPVVLLEGFGRRPLNGAAYKLLTTNVKREVSLNAEFPDRQNNTRPEVFVPLPVAQEPPEPRDVETFAPGHHCPIAPGVKHPAQRGKSERCRSASRKRGTDPCSAHQSGSAGVKYTYPREEKNHGQHIYFRR
jgi:hypothetical protein